MSTKMVKLVGGSHCLDGHAWVDSDFEGCEIIVERGDFSLTRCTFSNCSLKLTGRAANVAKLMGLFGDSLADKE